MFEEEHDSAVIPGELGGGAVSVPNPSYSTNKSSHSTISIGNNCLKTRPKPTKHLVFSESAAISRSHSLIPYTAIKIAHRKKNSIIYKAVTDYVQHIGYAG